MSMKKPTSGEENWQTTSPGKPGGGVVTDGNGRIVERTSSDQAADIPAEDEALRGSDENSATQSSSSTSPRTPAIDQPGKPPASR